MSTSAPAPTHTPAVDRQGNSPQCSAPCCTGGSGVHLVQPMRILASRLETSEGQAEVATVLQQEWDSEEISDTVGMLRTIAAGVSDTVASASAVNQRNICESVVIADALIDLIMRVPIEDDSRPAFASASWHADPAIVIDTIDTLYRIACADNMSGVRRAAVLRIAARFDALLARLLEAKSLWLGAARSMVTLATFAREIGVLQIADTREMLAVVPTMLHLYAHEQMQTDGHAFLVATAFDQLCVQPSAGGGHKRLDDAAERIYSAATGYDLLDQLARVLVLRIRRPLDSTWDAINGTAAVMLSVQKGSPREVEVSGLRRALIDAGLAAAVCSRWRYDRYSESDTPSGAGEHVLDAVVPYLTVEQREAVYRAGWIERMARIGCRLDFDLDQDWMSATAQSLGPQLLALLPGGNFGSTDDRRHCADPRADSVSPTSFALAGLRKCARSEADRAAIRARLGPLQPTIIQRLSDSPKRSASANLLMWRDAFKDVGLHDLGPGRKCSAPSCDKVPARLRTCGPSEPLARILTYAARCKFVSYCDTRCQTADWNGENGAAHKQSCRFLR